MELTLEQQRLRNAFREFADAHIVPHANAWDQAEGHAGGDGAAIGGQGLSGSSPAG